ncbi:MAG: hypothetical protein ACOVP1_08145, partial [Bacteroidia bacterium]
SAPDWFEVQYKNEWVAYDLSAKMVFRKTDIDSFKINRTIKPFHNGIQSIWYDMISYSIQIDDKKKGKTEPFPVNSNGYFSCGDLFKDQDNYLVFGTNSNSIILYRIK